MNSDLHIFLRRYRSRSATPSYRYPSSAPASGYASDEDDDDAGACYKISRKHTSYQNSLSHGLPAGYADTHHFHLTRMADDDDDYDGEYLYPYSNLADYRRSRLFTLAHQPISSASPTTFKRYYGTGAPCVSGSYEYVFGDRGQADFPSITIPENYYKMNRLHRSYDRPSIRVLPTRHLRSYLRNNPLPRPDSFANFRYNYEFYNDNKAHLGSDHALTNYSHLYRLLRSSRLGVRYWYWYYYWYWSYYWNWNNKHRITGSRNWFTNWRKR